MKKIILIEDNRNFKNVIEMIIGESLPECSLVMFSSDTEAIEAIASVDHDFDILLLDGDLGLFGGHGSNVLHILSAQQIRKVIVCSGNDSFIKEAKEKGVSVFLDKGFTGIRASKIGEHILELFNKVPTP